MKRILQAIFAIGLLFPLVAGAAEQDRPPFFKISHQGNTAWLLGSIHVGQENFYPFPAVIEQAFEEARVLALEADPTDPNIPQLMQRYAMADAPLPEDLEKRLMAYCQQHGVPCDTRLQPWLLSAQLAMMQMAQAGYQAELGVESYWLARKGAHMVWELEGMEYQLNLFDNLPDEVQHEMLAATLEPVDVSVMIDAWRSGDQQALAREIRTGLGDDDRLWQILMVERNRQMTATIGDWLETDGGLFVVIGAGHLVGNDAIPGLLKSNGLHVQDCWTEDCTKPAVKFQVAKI